MFLALDINVISCKKSELSVTYIQHMWKVFDHCSLATDQKCQNTWHKHKFTKQTQNKDTKTKMQRHKHKPTQTQTQKCRPKHKDIQRYIEKESHQYTDTQTHRHEFVENFFANLMCLNMFCFFHYFTRALCLWFLVLGALRG